MGHGALEPMDKVRKGLLGLLTVRCVSDGKGLPCLNLSDDIPHCQNQTIQFVLPVVILYIQAIKFLDHSLRSRWVSFPCVCLYHGIKYRPIWAH